MSSMRSASSMTRISMPVRSSLPRSKWSSRRPGVAISTSTPRVIFMSWSPKETPPIRSATFSFWLHAVPVEAFLDLRGELARRLQDQGARHAGAGAALLEQREHRQCEGCGLAGAGLGDAQDVAAREHLWDRLLLDGRRLRVARCGNRVEHLLAQSEFSEIHRWSRLLSRHRRSCA